MSANLESSPRTNKSPETVKTKKTKTKDKSSDSKSSTKKRKRDEVKANHENENNAADTSPKPGTTIASASAASPAPTDKKTNSNNKDASISGTQGDVEAPRKKRKYTKRQPRSTTTAAEDADADTVETAKGADTISPDAGTATGEGATTSTEKDAPRQKRKYTRRAPILVSNAPIDLSGADTSPFIQQTTSFYLPLAPITSHMPLEGLCAEHLSPMLLSYVQPFKGVVMGYSNARFSGSAAGPSEDSKTQDSQEEEGEKLGRVLAKSIDEYSAPHTWLTADFTLLKPDRSAWIEGHVSLQSKSHIGLVCWNLFNASIERRRMPDGWRWRGHDTDALEDLGPATSSKKGKKKKSQEGEEQEDDDGESSDEEDEGEEEEAGSQQPDAQGAKRHGKRNRHDLDGYWTDADGNEIGGTLKFRIRDLETTPSYGRENGFVSIEGSLLDEKTDLRNDKNEIARKKREQAREKKEKAALI